MHQSIGAKKIYQNYITLKQPPLILHDHLFIYVYVYACIYTRRHQHTHKQALMFCCTKNHDSCIFLQVMFLCSMFQISINVNMHTHTYKTDTYSISFKNVRYNVKVYFLLTSILPSLHEILQTTIVNNHSALRQLSMLSHVQCNTLYGIVL